MLSFAGTPSASESFMVPKTNFTDVPQKEMNFKIIKNNQNLSAFNYSEGKKCEEDEP